jgi:hypothetical protein
VGERRWWRIVGVAALGLGLPVALAGHAEASCIGPTISLRAKAAAPAAALVVDGLGWGTACHDVGPPPSGEGPLGVPQTGIPIHFVDADGERTRLGTVDAGDDYGFRLAVAVPEDAAVGVASVEAPGTRPVALVVEGEPPVLLDALASVW